MRAVQWLKRLDTALAKAMRLDVGYVKAHMASNADGFTRRALILDDICDATGMHLAIPASMVERLESLRFDPAAALEGASWHFPYRALRLGMEQGTDIPPCAVMFATKREMDAAFSTVGMHIEMPNLSDQEPLLLVVTKSTDSQHPELPGALTALHTLHEIKEMLNGTFKMGSDERRSHLDDAETATMQRVIRLVVSLGLYLSLDDAEPISMPRKTKWAPKIVRTSKSGARVRLSMLPPATRSDVGVTEQLVREHLRQLKAERYYHGKWAAWPPGSRYCLVKSHIRGAGRLL
jgi:hypothetical protein